jgi:DNA mismatch repair protein MLH1
MAGRIIQLDETTINRIAAGEVIQRPASALKELVENSLDAACTQVTIKVVDGGLRMLQIQDDGSGIHPDDFPQLCRRFTTSKIEEYEDLKRLSTFGYRGEALSSISQVADVTITSRRTDSALGLRGCFKGGELSKPPVPCALERGTTIQVERMFYNVPIRLQALKPHEEYRRCLEIVQKYAVHYADTSFRCMKDDQIEFSTAHCTQRADVVAEVLKCPSSEFVPLCPFESDYVKISGLASSSNFRYKKAVLDLFINNRAVDCSALRAIVENTYAAVLPKGAYFYVYLSLELPPDKLDVNVHPTKKEVRFANSAAILSHVQASLEQALVHSTSVRVFTVKTIPAVPKTTQQPSAQARKDHTETKLEWFIHKPQVFESRPAEEELTSVQELRAEVGDQGLMEEFVYVGTVSSEHFLFSVKTSLYLGLAPAFLCEWVYQDILNHFATFPSYEIPGGVSLAPVLELALNNPDIGYSPNLHPPKSEVIAKYCQLLKSQSPMLSEYFSLHIEDGRLTRVPVLVNGLLTPLASALPEFMIKLAGNPDWTQEKECFQCIARLLAEWYSCVEPGGEADYEHKVFPAVKLTLKGGALVEGQSYTKLASTEQLYRVFERC